MNAPIPLSAFTESYRADQHNTTRDELIRILNAEALDGSNPFTCVLDMLAGIAEERSQLENDRMERIGQAIQDCATFVEHKTGRESL